MQPSFPPGLWAACSAGWSQRPLLGSPLPPTPWWGPVSGRKVLAALGAAGCQQFLGRWLLTVRAAKESCWSLLVSTEANPTLGEKAYRAGAPSGLMEPSQSLTPPCQSDLLPPQPCSRGGGWRELHHSDPLNQSSAGSVLGSLQALFSRLSWSGQQGPSATCEGSCGSDREGHCFLSPCRG